MIPRAAKPALLGASQADLEAIATAEGHPTYRGRQLFQWIYRHGAMDFDQMVNIPQSLRTSLRASHHLGAFRAGTVNESNDGTRKYLFPTQHGGFVEAALIPAGDEPAIDGAASDGAPDERQTAPDSTRANRRLTLCLSTQVGCRRSCTFCQTARQGFQGNLSAGEILNQYHSIPERDEITNIVYMGMGEPLDNLEQTMASLALFVDPQGYALTPRRITLSTVGIHPQLEAFLNNEATRSVSLAISLHSPFPDQRRQIMPVENANPIEETIRLIRSRREDTTRRVSVEYTMFDGLNDSPRHVDGIARLLNGLRVRINLIPFHQLEGTSLRPTPRDRIEDFANLLRAKDFKASIRHSRGQDINAACGMLWTRHTEAPES